VLAAPLFTGTSVLISQGKNHQVSWMSRQTNQPPQVEAHPHPVNEQLFSAAFLSRAPEGQRKAYVCSRASILKSHAFVQCVLLCPSPLSCARSRSLICCVHLCVSRALSLLSLVVLPRSFLLSLYIYPFLPPSLPPSFPPCARCLPPTPCARARLHL